ncbi:MAG: 50S ribosomal protein L18 [Desulfobacterales bacterium]|jgi:large subunit ribosomal protein L18
MGQMNARTEARLKRKRRIRKKILGTPERPRLTIFRSARHIYAQLIDDTNGSTIASASSLDKSVKEGQAFDSKKSQAVQIGKLVAERAITKGVKKVVFDRNGYLYHGRVKAISDGAREAGLEF